MSIDTLPAFPPASPALSSSSFSSTSAAGRPRTLHRKPVPTYPDASLFNFNFSFSTPPGSPDVGPSTPISFFASSPASSVHHLSLDSPYRSRDLSSPEMMHDQPSSEDGYSSDEGCRNASYHHHHRAAPTRSGKFAPRPEANDRYAYPLLLGKFQGSPVEQTRGMRINDPQTVQRIFGASLQRSRRTSPTEESFPSGTESAEPVETLLDAPPESDFRAVLAERHGESTSVVMTRSGSVSSEASVHSNYSVHTDRLLKARKAAAAKAAWKDEFADMAAEDATVLSTGEDDPSAYVFEESEQLTPPAKKAPRTPSRRRTDGASSDVFSLDSLSRGGSPEEGDDDEGHGVLDRLRKSKFNIHLPLPGSSHGSRSASPISIASIGSPVSAPGDSPQAMIRGSSSPGDLTVNGSSPALSPSPVLSGKLASGYNIAPPLDLASAHMILSESIPRICTPQPASEADGAHQGHAPASHKFDFLHSKSDMRSAQPAYRTRHKHSNSTPGFGLRELREMRQAADMIERDANRPSPSRSSSIAEKKLKRKPVPKLVGQDSEGDVPELAVKVDTSKAFGGYFNPSFSFPTGPQGGAPPLERSSLQHGHQKTFQLSVDQPTGLESSSELVRTSSESFESSAYPHTPYHMQEFGLLAPAGRNGRRRSVSLSELDMIVPFTSAAAPYSDNGPLVHAFERISFNPRDAPGAHGLDSPRPIGQPAAPSMPPRPPSFFDVVTASHSHAKNHRPHHPHHHSRSSPSHTPPPVPAIPSPNEREVSGTRQPYWERRPGEATGSPSNPCSPTASPRKKMSMRRKDPGWSTSGRA